MSIDQLGVEATDVVLALPIEVVDVVPAEPMEVVTLCQQSQMNL